LAGGAAAGPRGAATGGELRDPLTIARPAPGLVPGASWLLECMLDHTQPDSGTFAHIESYTYFHVQPGNVLRALIVNLQDNCKH
jgi:hypothetical protein